MKNRTAIILAGGESSRMGRDKSMLPIDGKPMIANIAEHISPLFDELIIGANDTEKYKFLGFPVIPDRNKGMGPLMGILSTVEKSQNDLNFVIACDIPSPDIEFIRKMTELATECDIVMPVTDENKYEPLFAIYRKSVVPYAEKIIDSGKRRIVELFKYLDVNFIKMPKNDWYNNINTKTGYTQLCP